MEESANKSGMSTGMIIGIAVLVAIIFGGGAYAYVNNKAEKEKKDLNAQITQLQSQVSSAKTAITTPGTTTTTDETASWKSYSDTTTGFSFKYPENFTIYDGNSSADWATRSGKNKLNVSALKMAANGKTNGLGSDLDQVKKDSDIINAIKNKTILNVPGLDAKNVTVKTIGSTNFLIIFPGSAEGCFCWTANYITVVGDYFVEFSSHVSNRNAETAITDDEFNSKFVSDKQTLIEQLYGNIESIIATFQKTS